MTSAAVSKKASSPNSVTRPKRSSSARTSGCTSANTTRTLLSRAPSCTCRIVSAAETMRQVHDGARESNVRVVFAEVQPDVRAELERFGLVTLFGEDAFFETAADVIAAYQREAPAV